MDIEVVRKALRLAGLRFELRPGFYSDDVPSTEYAPSENGWSVGAHEDEYPVWNHGPCIVIIPLD